MIKKFKEYTAYVSGQPQTLFLIDAIGAMLTALSLFVVVKNANAYIGMPVLVVNYLAAIASCYCVYSLVCYVLIKDKYALFIRILAVLNILYGALTGILMVLYYQQLTWIGITYFLVETVMIYALAYLELRVSAARQIDR